jgi:hypothetical protein
MTDRWDYTEMCRLLDELHEKYPNEDLSKFLCCAVNDSWHRGMEELLKGLNFQLKYDSFEDYEREQRELGRSAND